LTTKTKNVRFWAELALEIEGRTTEFFNAGRSQPLTLELQVKSFTHQRVVNATWLGSILFNIDLLATYRRGVTATWFGVILAKIGILRRFFPQRWFYQLNALSPEPLIYFLVLGMAKDTR
jgi:hypothetical protein